PRLLRGGGVDRDPVAGTQDRQLTLLQRMRDRANGATPGQDVNQCVVVPIPRDVQPRSWLMCGVPHRYWRVWDTGPAVTVDLARDDPDQRAAVVGGQQFDVGAFDGLVARGGELVLLRQVHPELDAVEHSAAL